MCVCVYEQFQSIDIICGMPILEESISSQIQDLKVTLMVVWITFAGTFLGYISVNGGAYRKFHKFLWFILEESFTKNFAVPMVKQYIP